MENKVYLFNTLTRKVETVVPHEEGKIGMYTCGPTVYHFAHIGNLRSYIMEDVLEKSLPTPSKPTPTSSVTPRGCEATITHNS